MLAFAEDMVFMGENFYTLKKIVKGFEEYFLENQRNKAVVFLKGGFEC